MTLANAIKKLEKAGYAPLPIIENGHGTIVTEKAEFDANGNRRWYDLRISIQGGDVIIVSSGVRGCDTDCRSYWNNLTQALRHW
jgi:Mrp family chromosome partitioning ATPase